MFQIVKGLQKMISTMSKKPLDYQFTTFLPRCFKIFYILNQLPVKYSSDFISYQPSQFFNLQCVRYGCSLIDYDRRSGDVEVNALPFAAVRLFNGSSASESVLGIIHRRHLQTEIDDCNLHLRANCRQLLLNLLHAVLFVRHGHGHAHGAVGNGSITRGRRPGRRRIRRTLPAAAPRTRSSTRRRTPKSRAHPTRWRR